MVCGGGDIAGKGAGVKLVVSLIVSLLVVASRTGGGIDVHL